MSTGSRTLFVTDLDRTFLRSDSTLGAETVRLINAAIARGVLFTYATARSFRSSRRVTAPIRLDLPVITYGGTITAHHSTGAPTDVRLIPRDIAIESLLAREHPGGAEPILHTFEDGRDWLRWRPDHATVGTTAFLAARAEDPRLRPITADDPVEPGSLFYLTFLAPAAELTRIRETLRPQLTTCVAFLSEDPATPGLSWLEIHDAAGTKAEAICRLREEVGADHLIVFGDNHNDGPMFEIADEAYAVADAIPELRAIATDVIGSNDTDSVARWIDARTRVSL